jgi:hypothetical protein
MLALAIAGGCLVLLTVGSLLVVYNVTSRLACLKLISDKLSAMGAGSGPRRRGASLGIPRWSRILRIASGFLIAVRIFLDVDVGNDR